MRLKKTWSILKGTFTEFGEDNVLRLSAALAYYAIFSIGPLLAIVVGLAGLAFGNDSVRHHIQDTLQGMLGKSSAKTVDSMMAAQHRGGSLITTIIGIIVLLFGAAGVFGQLQDSLNTIWEVKAKPGGGIWSLLRQRFLSLAMVLGVGFLLLVSLALSTALAALSGAIDNMIPMGQVIAHAVDFIVSFGVVTVLFALIFKFLPDVKIPWSRVWIGAIGTALLFTAGKFLLGLYLGRQSTTSSYGAAGSVIAVLMWVYYASVILFFGAEFTQVYAKQTGTKIVPAKYAVPVTPQERAEEGIPHNREEKGQPKSTAPKSPPPRHAPGAMTPEPVAFASWLGSVPSGRSLGDVVRKKPWQYVGMALVAGVVGGVLLRFKGLRKGLRLYTALQKPETIRH